MVRCIKFGLPWWSTLSLSPRAQPPKNRDLNASLNIRANNQRRYGAFDYFHGAKAPLMKAKYEILKNFYPDIKFPEAFNRKDLDV